MVVDALSAALGTRTPKTKKGRRILRKREPQPKEEAKTALIVAGTKASHEVQTLLRDLHKVRSPLSTLFSRKHDIHPFEDFGKLEALCVKSDHSLFAFGSSSKKRPFRLIIGRLFANQLLDMQEFSIKDYKSTQIFKQADATLGSKPLVLFQGSAFETDEKIKRTKSLLLDFFSGPRPEKIMLQGMEHVVVCSAIESSAPASASSSTPSVLVKRFRLKLTKSASKLPRTELVEVGPSFKMELDRSKDPDRDRWKQSIKVPKEIKPKKVKNVSKNPMGKRQARVHLGVQNFDQIHTVHHGESKRKKLKKSMAEGTKASAPAQGEA
jgi:ribosome production factor 2